MSFKFFKKFKILYENNMIIIYLNHNKIKNIFFLNFSINKKNNFIITKLLILKNDHKMLLLSIILTIF